MPVDAKFITTDHLITASQHYENQNGRNNLVQHLRDKIDTTGKSPTAVHDLIASLPVRIIFTTNYDDLIEQALRKVGKRYSVVVATIDLAFADDDRVQVVKLCGALNRPDSIIFTKRDYSSYFANHPRLAERLRSTLESKTALFLGYSLQDPFINQIWDNIGLDYGKYRRVCYATMFHAQKLERDYLVRRGIHVIDLVPQPNED